MVVCSVGAASLVLRNQKSTQRNGHPKESGQKRSQNHGKTKKNHEIPLGVFSFGYFFGSLMKADEMSSA